MIVSEVIGGGRLDLTESRKISSDCYNCGETMKPGAAICRSCYCVVVEMNDAFDPRTGPINRQPDLALVRKRAEAMIAQLRRELGSAIQLDHASDREGPLRTRIREIVDADQELITNAERALALHAVLDELFGFGPVGPLIRDSTTQNVFCTGTGPIFVERNGQLQKTVFSFESQDHLRSTIDRLLGILGLSLDEASPVTLGQLPSGLIIRVAIPPKVKQPTLSVWAPTEQSAFLG